MPHSLLNKMHEYKAQPQFYPWHVYFQVLNNLENAASLNNLHPRKPRASKGMGKEGRNWEREKRSGEGKGRERGKGKPWEASLYRSFLDRRANTIGHVLNEQGTGYEHIFSWYEHSISIELKMGHVI